MNASVEAAWAVLEELTDPEIPVISLRELGILRDVRAAADGLEVVITPTYSGCPAMGQIEDDVKVVDVSPDNDWSAVRVWYAPLGQLGGTHWPVEGFIYPGKAKKSERLPVRNVTVAAARTNDPIADIIRQKLGF